MIIDLSFKKLAVGCRIKTKKGFFWKKIAKDMWLDESSRLVWMPEKNKKLNHNDAQKLQNKTKRLPTKEEFEKAEKHGIREILNMRNKYYWSGSVYSYHSCYAYNFSGSDGTVGFDFRTYGNGSARYVVGR
jgi:hypothetical protein